MMTTKFLCRFATRETRNYIIYKQRKKDTHTDKQRK